MFRFDLNLNLKNHHAITHIVTLSVIILFETYVLFIHVHVFIFKISN